MDGENPVPGALEVVGHAVAVPVGTGGQADDGDGPHRLQPSQEIRVEREPASTHPGSIGTRFNRAQLPFGGETDERGFP